MKQLNMNEIQFSDEAIIRIIAGIANERIPHFNEIEVKHAPLISEIKADVPHGEDFDEKILQFLLEVGAVAVLLFSWDKKVVAERVYDETIVDVVFEELKKTGDVEKELAAKAEIIVVCCAPDGETTRPTIH